jgi:hypothetical protein
MRAVSQGHTARRHTTSLPRHVSLSLRQRAGDRIECTSGSLWITQDGDLRDIVLRAGESFRLDRSGTALISALTDARLAVHRAAPAGLASRLGRGLAAARVWLAPASPHAGRRSAA